MFAFIFELHRFTVGDGATTIPVEKVLSRHGRIQRQEHVQEIYWNSKASLPFLPRSANRGQQVAVYLVKEV